MKLKTCQWASEELEEEENDEVDEGKESAGGQRSTAGHSKPADSNNAAAGLKSAVLFGLYPGAMPDELKDLTYVELSMVAPVNSMTKLHLSGGKSYHQAMQPTYTVMNNVNTIAKRLPRRLTTADTAILRTKKGDVPKDYTLNLINHYHCNFLTL